MLKELFSRKARLERALTRADVIFTFTSGRSRDRLGVANKVLSLVGEMEKVQKRPVNVVADRWTSLLLEGEVNGMIVKPANSTDCIRTFMRSVRKLGLGCGWRRALIVANRDNIHVVAAVAQYFGFRVQCKIAV